MEKPTTNPRILNQLPWSARHENRMIRLERLRRFILGTSATPETVAVVTEAMGGSLTATIEAFNWESTILDHPIACGQLEAIECTYADASVTLAAIYANRPNRDEVA